VRNESNLGDYRILGFVSRVFKLRSQAEQGDGADQPQSLVDWRFTFQSVSMVRDINRY
jgi:hypothetical protein